MKKLNKKKIIIIGIPICLILLCIIIFLLFHFDKTLYINSDTADPIETQNIIDDEDKIEIEENTVTENSDDNIINSNENTQNESDNSGRQSVDTHENTNNNSSNSNNNSISNSNNDSNGSTNNSKSDTSQNDVPNTSSNQSSSSTEDAQPKKWTDTEIESYARNIIVDFQLDFKYIEECEAVGNKWMARGWRYDCTYVPIPDSKIVATMLTVTSGEYYCDNAYTKNLTINWRSYSSPISVISYLRDYGYPCTNLEDIY